MLVYMYTQGMHTMHADSEIPKPLLAMVASTCPSSRLCLRQEKNLMMWHSVYDSRACMGAIYIGIKGCNAVIEAWRLHDSYISSMFLVI